jgi:hypothetical protein
MKSPSSYAHPSTVIETRWGKKKKEKKRKKNMEKRKGEKAKGKKVGKRQIREDQVNETWCTFLMYVLLMCC